MNLKKIVASIIFLIISLFFAFIIGECIWLTTPTVYPPSLLSYEYYKAEQSINSEPVITFFKYYYNKDIEEIENNDYVLVEENVESIKNNISNSLNKIHEFDESISNEFNYDIITSNDFYFSEIVEGEELFILHYYDVDERILYVTYFPVEYSVRLENTKKV